MNTNILMMAFAKGAVAPEEGSKFKRYIGVAPVSVLAVNPSRSEIDKIYESNATFENEPEYTGEKDGVKFAQVSFYIKTDTERSNGINITTKMTFFLRKEFRFNADKTKVQIIDKYGRTGWVTEAEAKEHKIPVYKNGPANIDADYRPCYNGEEDLTNFIKAYLNIPNVLSFIDKKWVPNPNAKPEECEARLSTIENMFDGNFKELKEIITYQPNNKVKVLFGVRTNDEGKQYQTVYTQMVLKNAVTDYGKLKDEIADRKANGAYQTTEFEVCPIKEYEVKPTSFNSDIDDLPAGDIPKTSWF